MIKFNYKYLHNIFIILGITLSMLNPVFAVNPNEILSNPALESRAREISKSVRCLVCSNQSIDDSSADLAKELRIIVRERITQGDSNEQVIKYLTTRYGQYVLLEPSVSNHTILLWAFPAIIFITGLIIGAIFLRGRSVVMPLNSEEKKAVDNILKGKK